MEKLTIESNTKRERERDEITEAGEGKNKPILSDNQAIAILAAKMEENEGQLIRIVEKINEIIEENMGQVTKIHTLKLCLFCNRGAYNSQRVCSSCIEERRPRFSIFWYILLTILLIFPGYIYKTLKEQSQKEWDLKYL